MLLPAFAKYQDTVGIMWTLSALEAAIRIKNFCRCSNLIFCCIEDTCCVGSFYDVYKRCGKLKEGEALMMHVISFCGMEIFRKHGDVCWIVLFANCKQLYQSVYNAFLFYHLKTVFVFLFFHLQWGTFLFSSFLKKSNGLRKEGISSTYLD